MKESLPRSISLSLRIYAWLLTIGPAAFRRNYSEPAIQVFRQCCLDAYRQRGAYGVLRLWLPTFIEAVIGMLAEYFTDNEILSERMIRMLRVQRRSMIGILSAFIVFGLGWLYFQGLIDPLSQWDPLVRLHLQIGIFFRVLRIAGEIAFFLMLIGGLPILYTAFKQALATKRRDILVFFGLCLLMLLVFGGSLLLILAHSWSFDPHGILFSVICLLTLLVVTITIALVVARSELNERILSFALLPAAGVTLAMGVALIAGIIENVLLTMYAPQLAQGIILWLIMMTIATLGAIFALWRSFRARMLAAA